MLPESPEALAGPLGVFADRLFQVVGHFAFSQWRVLVLHQANKAYEASPDTGPPAARARPTKKAPQCRGTTMPFCWFWFRRR